MISIQVLYISSCVPSTTLYLFILVTLCILRDEAAKNVPARSLIYLFIYFAIMVRILQSKQITPNTYTTRYFRAYVARYPCHLWSHCFFIVVIHLTSY